MVFVCRWGILGAGGISEKFVKDLLIDPKTRQVSDLTHRFSAVGSRSLAKANNFINRIGSPQEPLPKAYGSYQELVQDAEIDVIYIGTPHSSHFADAMLCLGNKKNVLCEKPMTVNAAQARELCKVAKKNNCFLMEAVWTRFFPITYSFQKVIASGKIGEIERVSADCSIEFPLDSLSSDHRLVSPHLAGGALLDLGPYSWSMLALTLVHQNIRPESSPFCESKNGTSASFDLPVPKISASGDLYKHANASPTSRPVDASIRAVLKFPTPSGATAEGLLIASMIKSTDDDRAVTIFGTKGQIRISSPTWAPNQFAVTVYENNSKDDEIPPRKEGNKLGPEEVHSFEIPGKAHGYMWEADEVARCIESGQLESKRMAHGESILMMEVFDEIRRQIGVEYPQSVEAI